jgi:DNA-binding XRE family transcriptional regulator
MGSRLTTEQIKAARMLLAWDQHRLAMEAGVSSVTVKRIEGAPGVVTTTPKTEQKLRVALEQAGVVFLDADTGGGVGVRKKE